MEKTVIIESSNNYGITQEVLVESILAQYGAVSVPLGNSERYDCILDLNRDNKFIRIQIKSLNILEDGDSITVPMKNKNIAKNIDKPYTDEEIDYIAIAYKDQVYLIKPQNIGTLTLRINKPKYSNQNWLENYRIDKVLNIDYKSWLEQKEEIRQKTKNICRICGSPILKSSEVCQFCYKRQQQQNGKRPSKEEMILNLQKVAATEVSFLWLGETYNVSDTTIRNWCKYYNLPYKIKDIKEVSDWSIF